MPGLDGPSTRCTTRCGSLRPAAARPGPGPWPVPSPQVRLAQVQVLTRWNDAEGRTSEEVLAVLDRAISRTMLSLAAIPAPQADSSAWPGPELAEKTQ